MVFPQWDAKKACACIVILSHSYLGQLLNGCYDLPQVTFGIRRKSGYGILDKDHTECFYREEELRLFSPPLKKKTIRLPP